MLLSFSDCTVFVELERLTILYFRSISSISLVLLVASDFNLYRSYIEDLKNEELEVIYETNRLTKVKELKIERLRDILPLYYISLTLIDKELRAFFVTYTNNKIS